MAGNSRPTQVKRILEYLEEYGTITSFDAENHLGVRRLASRISEMKKNGMRFKWEWVTVKDRFGCNCRVKRYWLEDESNGEMEQENKA